MHCTPEQLALAALGEALPADDARHLDQCASCQAEVTALRRSVDALAVPELAATGPAVVPPADVWRAIAAATGVQMSPRRHRAVTQDAAVTVPRRPEPSPEHVAGTHGMLRRDQPRARGGTGVPHYRRRLILTASAAAALGAGIALGAVTLAHGSAGTPVAVTPLRAVDGGAASGTAVVVERADHTLDLRVTLHGPPVARGYYEAWLADAGLDRMVAVGALHEGTTTLPLPGGLSLGTYSVIDVSVQQLDGNPAHSDHSVVRGRLR
ncbi:MAG TPA: anti-sigma factor [Blastococcus sp.]|nr:anti-sigma factor [Blastococcus sp.]